MAVWHCYKVLVTINCYSTSSLVSAWTVQIKSAQYAPTNLEFGHV